MERLWAPWRIRYIKAFGTSGDECIFCTKPAEHRDEENFILFRGAQTFVILNIFPYNSGHIMVAPYRHVDTLERLSDEELTELFKITQVSLRALRETFRPHGFNVGLNIGRTAGAGFEGHIHVHIVPRWNGDTNFMPVIADTKVIPEALEETYQNLRPALLKALEEEGLIP